MDLKNTLDKINRNRHKVEACFVFALWKDPTLYEEYSQLNEGKDETLQNPDSVFYFNLGKAMYQKGFKAFDNITITTFLDGKPDIKRKYEEYGGYHEIEQLRSLINMDNIDTYFDEICRMNSLSMLAKKTNELFDNVERFDNASNEDVYNTFELMNNSISLTTSQNEKIDNLVIDDKFVSELESGENVGYQYNKFCPLMNYITLGAEPSSLFLLGGHSGTGKSSFAFANMMMGFHYSGTNSAIISNEMGISSYKILLLEHILTNELSYWGLTRKEIRKGVFNDEQKSMIEKAQEISATKYNDIKFVKMFSNDTNKIIKYLKKLKSLNIKCVLLDTFKSDDSVDLGMVWQSLVLDSRKIFQTADKLGMCVITTYQLSLHTVNQRFLDASCLSNSKQIKEVYSTMIYCRPVWDDEFPGERYDIKPYKLNRQNSAIKESVVLDRNKKYMLAFIDKTRADEDKQVLVYEWLAHFNHWKELGFAKVINDHRGV